MAKTLQFRRGTTSEISAITGAVGELFVDTTKDTVVVMDGSTAGGFPLATEAALTTGLASKADAAAVSSGLAAKQNTLVSGTNIKTINGTSVLGSGNIVISGGGGGGSADLSAVAQDVIPSANATFNIGSSVDRWNDLYLADGIFIDQVSVTAETTTTYPIETHTFTGFINGQVYVNGSELIVAEASANNGWGAWASQNWNTAHLIGAKISATSLAGTEAPWSDTITGFTSGGPYYGFTLAGSHGFGSHITSLTIVAPSATPLVVHSLNSDSEIVAPSAAIGDVYYTNNIVSPIPVITTTVYGTTTVVPPLVVNAPLSVLSYDTSGTAFATLSGSDLTGSHSGGTNNAGVVSSGISNTSSKGNVYLWVDKPTDNVIAFFKALREGDIITGIGTNGLYTGTIEFTISDLSFGPRYDLGGPYYDIGEHGFVQLTGKLTNVNDAPSGSDRSVALNIITAKRPYAESVIKGGLKPTYVDSKQVVADQVIVNKKLDALQSTYLGAKYNKSSGIYNAYGQGVGALGVYIDATTQDFVYVSLSGAINYPVELQWSPFDPMNETYERTVTVMLTSGSDIGITLAHGGANTAISTIDTTKTNYAYYQVPTYWAGNSYPTQVKAGRTLEIKFKFVASNGGFVGLYCDWREYY